MAVTPLITPNAPDDGVAASGTFEVEPKWDDDGWRSQVILDGVERRLGVVTRSGRRIEGSVPELVALLEAVGERRMVLDGELVAGDGSPESFYRLGPRLATSQSHALERARRREPLTLVIFDVLWLDDESLVDCPIASDVAVWRP